MNIDHEVEQLKEFIKRLGECREDGTYAVKFGVLFGDKDSQNVFEALVGTLRAAKKRGVIDFKGQMLLSPMHDDVDVVLLQE